MPSFRRICVPLGLLLTAVGGNARGDVDFRKEVLPILQKSCTKCHRSTYKESGKEIKPKGGLAIDGAASLLKGGSEGQSVTPDDPDKSPLYTRCILPPNHEDVMPPKGKGDPLSFRDTEILKNWILEGAKFGDWKGVGDGAGPLPTPGAPGIPKKQDAISVGVGKPSDDAIRAVTQLGAQVSAIASDSPLLRVEWVSGGSAVTDKEVAKILSLGENVTELSLAGAKITDESLKLIAKLPRLTWLNLNNTPITDAGVAHLKQLANLTYLNLYSTGVSDDCLPSLKDMRKLQALHCWKTRITASGADKIRKVLPSLRVSME